MRTLWIFISVIALTGCLCCHAGAVPGSSDHCSFEYPETVLEIPDFFELTSDASAELISDENREHICFLEGITDSILSCFLLEPYGEPVRNFFCSKKNRGLFSISHENLKWGIEKKPGEGWRGSPKSSSGRGPTLAVPLCELWEDRKDGRAQLELALSPAPDRTVDPLLLSVDDVRRGAGNDFRDRVNNFHRNLTTLLVGLRVSLKY